MPWFERSTPTPPRVPSRRSLRRRLLLRKVVAALLLGCATWLGLELVGLGTSGEGAVTVLVAGRDLPAGHTLTVSDTASRRVPVAAAAESVRRVTRESVEQGRVLVAPVHAGEMLSETRLRLPDSFDDLAPDRRAVHIPLRDNGTTRLLHPGSRVDLHSTAGGGLVVADVTVLQVDAPASSGGGLGAVSSDDTSGVVIAVPVSAAGKVMSALGSAGSEGGTIHLALRAR